MNFVIWSPDYNENSGGIIALHVLANLIAEQGENCYIYSTKTFEGSSAKLIQNENVFNFDKNNTMYIYPEVICGNPFGGKFVTRWLLNTPGVLGGDGIYEPTDLVYKYYDYFDAPDESKVLGELRTFKLKLDKFVNKGLERNGECYIVRKGSNKVLDKHRSDSLNIDEYINDDYLIDVFNSKDFFVSYDSMCFHLQQAALCGCVPVVIPDEGVSKEVFIEKAPVNKYGVAYGFDDIPHARETMHLLKEYLEGMESESIELVKKYINNCYDKMDIIKSR
jgi:hypothetical protein